ncbi:hypothetical protein ABF231_001007 [Yersinia ruckeri]|uniref:hypothetical protein n=1 Tax=Yersinia ruckeri TaxID=29486 RepID=UPI00223908D3|nr:hypothetical protein [Yersinia ruckeri]EKN4697761.1 hypothetical protein [Yersinia ruckeri]MCW6584777.1 hypothetical protein [Yersinia ruckeri]
MSQKEKNVGIGQRDIAMAALENKVDREIGVAKQLAKRCEFWDLMFLLYELRLNRLCMILPEINQRMSKGDIIGTHLNDEALKYAISLAAKYGEWKSFSEINKPAKNFDYNLAHKLEEHARRINAFFDTKNLLHVSEVSQAGHDHIFQLDICAGMNKPENSLLFQFGLRIERFAKTGKDNTLTAESLIERFQNKYADLAKQFEHDSGISLSDYCAGILRLHQCLIERMKFVEGKITDENGLVEPLSEFAFIATTRSMLFTDYDLKKSFSDSFVTFLYKNAFEADSLSDKELRFHYLTRRPFLMGEGFALFSPELVFDSIIDNTHYTFLESEDSRHQYKTHNSDKFIDDVVSQASVAGYQEVDREIWLTEGRNRLGDIDLVLHNPETSHTLMVECKNHTLPLAVYYRSPEEVRAHIQTTRDWVVKVNRRIAYLKSPASSYKISGEWDYVIVTHMPEPLSHESDLLIMTTGEFGDWLSMPERATTFAKLHFQICEADEIIFSPAEINDFMEAGFIVVRPGALKT